MKDKSVDGKKVGAVLTTALMSFTGILTETSLNVTFPTMMKQFNVSLNTVQWLATGYLLMIAIIMLGSSYLNQRFTARQLFAAACMTFTLGSLICALAPNFIILLLGRLLSAFGAGLSTPLMFNLIVEIMPQARWGFFMGLAGLVIAMAPTLGPAFGGAVNYYMNWRWIFIFVIIMTILVFAAGMFVIGQYHEQVKQSFDWLSYFLLSTALVLTTLSLNQVGRGWRQWQLWTGLLLAGVLFVLFKKSSDRSSKKLIDLRVFQHPLFIFGIVPYFLLQFINIGISFVLPNYAQIVNRSSSLIGGLVLLPGSILAGLLNPLFGRFYDQVGGRIALGIGGATVLLGCSLFAWFGLNLTAMLIIVIYGILMLGHRMSFSNTLTETLKWQPKELQSDATAIMQTGQQLAGSVGETILASIIASSQAQHNASYRFLTAQGSYWAFIFCVSLAILILFSYLLLFMSEKRLRQENNK